MDFKRLICLVLATCGTANAAVIYVDSTATGADNGSSWSDAYDTLQEALDAASFGDEIWVAEGEFFPSRKADYSDPSTTSSDSRDATFWIPRGVYLYGGFDGTETSIGDRPSPLNHTILNGDIGTSNDDSDNSYRVVFYRVEHGGGYGSHNYDQSEPSGLDGFKVINANDDSSDSGAGAVILFGVNGSVLATPHFFFANCWFEGNASNDSGGGIYNPFLNSIYACTFVNNSTTGNGGGIAISQSQSYVRDIKDCRFDGNTADGNGGGIAIYGNTISGPTSDGRLFTNCVFSGNYSDNNGGGIYFSDQGDTPTIALVNTLLYENEAANNGGGLFLHGSSSPATNHSYADIRNSTFADNIAGSGGGLYFQSPADSDIYNSIFWGNTAMSVDQISSGAGVTYTCVEGGYTGTGNISTSPNFYDASNDNYTLRNDSPALDAASNSSLPDDLADLDNDSTTAEYLPLDLAYLPRRIDAGVTDSGSGTAPIVDMGAYERCSADMDRNGVLNGTDATLFCTAYGNSDPDADINGDGTLDYFDATAFTTSYNSGCGF